MRPPSEDITGTLPRHAAIQLMGDSMRPKASYTMQRHTAKRLANIAVLSMSLVDLQEEVRKQIDARPKRAIDAHIQATNILTPSLAVGEFLLICKPTKPTHKLEFYSTGPRRVTTVKSTAFYVVQNLITRKEQIVHVTRIGKYDGFTDGEKVPKEVLDLGDRRASMY